MLGIVLHIVWWKDQCCAVFGMTNSGAQCLFDVGDNRCPVFVRNLVPVFVDLSQWIMVECLKMC